jgi:phospholipid-binding lipoprotein MlaA
MRLPASLMVLAATGALLAACAHAPPASDPEALAEDRQTNDPLEPTNRVFYRVNDTLDTYILAPVARGYRYVVPGAVRTPVHNVLVNITSPVLLANDVLEAKPRRAGDTFMRFLINTTVGGAGLFDVASGWGYPAHDADFGLTLAVWGWGGDGGPFLFLPVLGPSDPRDATGFAGDIVLDPFTWASFGGSKTLGYSRYGLGAVDARERVLDQVDQIKKTALDPYATFRSLYRQHRRSQVDETRGDDAATVPAWFNHQ